LRKATTATPALRAPLDAELGCVAGDDLAPAALAVIDEDRAAVGDDAPRLVDDRLAAAEVAQIRGDHADAMAVVTLQIGLDEVVGDDFSLRLGAAGGGEDPACHGSQICSRNKRHQDSPNSSSRAAMREG
jgi:hypothetical protein